MEEKKTICSSLGPVTCPCGHMYCVPCNFSVRYPEPRKDYLDENRTRTS